MAELAAPTPLQLEREPALRRRRWIAVLVAVGLLLAGVGGTVAILGATGAFGTEVEMESSTSPGLNPFMPPVSTNVPSTAPVTTAGGPIAGDTHGLYGGTLNSSTCDPNQMVAFLQASPEKAAAWAGAQSIQPSEIPAFVAGLTPTVLRSDTTVTNHGYSGGEATPRQTVLQAGTAVLIDNRGVPRVRCECGNPLAEPQTSTRVRYEGARWPGFSEHNITIINRSVTVINVFVIYDVWSMQPFYRLPGSRGDRDTLVNPPIVYPPPVDVSPPAEVSPPADERGPRVEEPRRPRGEPAEPRRDRPAPREEPAEQAPPPQEEEEETGSDQPAFPGVPEECQPTEEDSSPCAM